MPTFVLDTVAESEHQSEGAFQSLVRGGMITDMDTSGNSADFLVQANQLIRGNTAIVTADGRHPTQPNLFYAGSRIVGLSTDAVQFRATFNSFQGLQESVYIINDSSYESIYEGNFVPGTRIPIGVRYIDSTNGANSIPYDLATMRFSRTMQQITVQRLIYGDGDADRQNKNSWMNKVNDAVWQGLPIAYWRVNRYEVELSRYSGYFMRTIGAVAKTDEDCSEFSALQSRMTGRYVYNTSLAANCTAIGALPYKRNIINDTSVSSSLRAVQCGIVRVGPYDTANLSALFGF